MAAPWAASVGHLFSSPRAAFFIVERGGLGSEDERASGMTGDYLGLGTGTCNTKQRGQAETKKPPAGRTRGGGKEAKTASLRGHPCGSIYTPED